VGLFAFAADATSTRERRAPRLFGPIACLAALFLALAGLAAQTAEPNFIWKATSKGGGTVYLVGSVHLLSSDYYPLAPAFENAFKASDLLVEELDLGEMLAPASQMRLLTRGMLPAGQSLDQVLSAATLLSLANAVAELGMPLEPLKQFKPWMLAITLQSMAWQKAGFDAEHGLDRHFYEMARKEGKAIRGLETLEFQISRFDGMTRDVQDRMLAETLEELKKTDATFTRVADAWKRGDVKAVEDQVLADLKSEPEMYERLLVDRNRVWLPQIEALFSRPLQAFVVVGAAHLIGADGLLEMLRAKGYAVSQM
jgi:uncharacterized protein YbaP (TraB family)